MGDNTLAYIDQASFLGLRALGRGPIVQTVWVYDRPVDIDGLRRLRRELGHGLLGRRIERSVLPFGRHRWVSDTSAPTLDLSVQEISRSQVGDWANSRLAVPIDPERGPGWRLAVQPLSDGGGAVSLTASHSLVDGLGFIAAVTDAVNGVRHDLGYPPPGSRPRRRALAQDARQTLAAIPEMAAAVVASARVARAERADLTTSIKAAGDVPPGDDVPMVPPSVITFVDIDQWDACAKRLGGSSNSLFAGLATRIGARLGRLNPDGRANLSWPVSERTAGDTRANALVSVSMTADPDEVLGDLGGVRAAMRQALAESEQTSVKLTGPLPLTPFTPKIVLRRLEGMVLAVNDPIGCSNLGEPEDAFSRPDGTDADFVLMRGVEPNVTSRELNRIGGQLVLGGIRARGRFGVSVSAWSVRGPNSKAALRELVSAAYADFGLTERVEL